MSLHVVPILQREAKAFVKEHHRHHTPPLGTVFQSAVSDGGRIVGVIMVGRPVARNLDDGWHLEATRCCTNGHKNAASMLYGVARRVAKDLGYKNCYTYTLESEPGTSLRAAGWICEGLAGGGTWNRPALGRLRDDSHPLIRKMRWRAW